MITVGGMPLPDVGNSYFGINNYYNPYMVIEERRRQLEQYEEEVKTQKSIFEKLCRSHGERIGRSEEDTNSILNPVITQEIKKESFEREVKLKHYEYLSRLANAPESTIFNKNKIIVNNMALQAQEQLPLDTGLCEFLSKGKYIYRDMCKENILLDSRKGINNLYNSDQYRQLVSLHSGAGPTIDDLEIKLPNRMVNEYAIRRKMFFDSILK